MGWGGNHSALAGSDVISLSIISLPAASAAGFLLPSSLRLKWGVEQSSQLEILSPEIKRLLLWCPCTFALGPGKGSRQCLQEADGLVYCTFQNISTARLAGAVASLGQTGPQDSGRDPWGLSTGQQAPLSKGRF